MFGGVLSGRVAVAALPSSAAAAACTLPSLLSSRCVARAGCWRSPLYARRKHSRRGGGSGRGRSGGRSRNNGGNRDGRGGGGNSGGGNSGGGYRSRGGLGGRVALDDGDAFAALKRKYLLADPGRARADGNIHGRRINGDGISGIDPLVAAPSEGSLAAGVKRARGIAGNSNNSRLLDAVSSVDDSAHVYTPDAGMPLTLPAIATLTQPHRWYPFARSMQRRIVLHVGDTNSGKTRAALDALRASESGIYCAPLRLLAHEVYDTLNDVDAHEQHWYPPLDGDATTTGDDGDGDGYEVRVIGSDSSVAVATHDVTNGDLPPRMCNLLTGQQREYSEGARFLSCTVEMAPLDAAVDVAVIDEIQMIGDESRGWAWTRALLGVPAATVHVCGNASAVGVVRRLAAQCGDELEVVRYERLSPLSVQKRPVGSVRSFVSQLQRGDCVVAFSRREVHMLKARIESLSAHKCCVVYGSLPPDTRRQQVLAFNDAASPYTVLVATDAVGMGLNLNIRRIIFSTLRKYDGVQTRELSAAELKQIAGRAGRFRSRYPTGYVTAFDKYDLERARGVVPQRSVPPVEQCGLFPTFEHLAYFDAVSAGIGGAMRLSELLQLFEYMARLDERSYVLCDFEETRQAAAAIDDLPMTLREQYTFATAPLDLRSAVAMVWFRRFALQYAAGEEVTFDVNPTSAGISHRGGGGGGGGGAIDSRDALRQYESAYKVADMYLWLANRLELFTDVEHVHAVREEWHERISDMLQRQSVKRHGGGGGGRYAGEHERRTSTKKYRWRHAAA